MRHVVTENRRVLDVVAALASGADPRRIGPALSTSHASLRHDFAVTTPALDLAVACALDHGAYGARMTGGGFGGSIIALVDAGAVQPVVAAVTAAFGAAGYGPPAHFIGLPSAGARRLR